MCGDQLMNILSMTKFKQKLNSMVTLVFKDQLIILNCEIYQYIKEIGFIRDNIIVKNNNIKQQVYENDSFLMYFELQSFVIEMDQQIKGHIVLHTKKRMPNEDLTVTFNGLCIYYSENPNKEMTTTDHTLVERQNSMIEELSAKQRNHPTIETRIESFLQGSQVLHYIGANQKQLEYLQQNQEYYMPFSFYLPPTSPPSINFMSFPPLFISIKYSLSISNLIQQELLLYQPESNNLIEQLTTNTLDISIRKYCLYCLGDYRIQVSVTVNDSIIKVKVLYYRKAARGCELYLEKIKVKIIAQIIGVGINTLVERQLKLEILEYNILGNEFIYDKNKLNFRSYDNELFKLVYYVKLELMPKKYVSVDLKNHQTVNIPF